ncbi:MAG: hypothetical protein LBU36_03990 [Clostridiales bacterium]|jgi:hypothetical protein|nr:hypothetical protein [Clostridiales bacterium]
MAIRPVDLQLLVQQTQEIQKHQPDNGARQNSQNLQFTDMLQKQVQQEQETILQSDKSEKNDVDKDGKNGGNSAKQQKRRNSARERERSKTKAGALSMFDVSI